VSFAAKTLVAFLLVIALIPATQAADPPRTGIGNQMTEMFDTMLNYTEPTAHLGQRRGVLTGGSLNARNRIMNESLWHFVPPSFDAGCGGIDLFAAAMTDTGFADPLQTLMSVRKGTLSRIALGSANSPTPEADIERSLDAVS
jgi:conjugative transfer pilus assembly protein TraH